MWIILSLYADQKDKEVGSLPRIEIKPESRARIISCWLLSIIPNPIDDVNRQRNNTLV